MSPSSSPSVSISGSGSKSAVSVDLPPAALESVVAMKKKKKKGWLGSRRVTQVTVADWLPESYSGYFRRASSGELAGDASGLRCT